MYTPLLYSVHGYGVDVYFLKRTVSGPDKPEYLFDLCRSHYLITFGF